MYIRTTGISHSDPATGPAPKCGNLQRDSWNWEKRGAICTSLKNQHSRSDRREIQQCRMDSCLHIWFSYRSSERWRIWHLHKISFWKRQKNLHPCRTHMLKLQSRTPGDPDSMDSLEDLELNKRIIALFTDSLSPLQGLDSDRDDLILLKIKQSGSDGQKFFYVYDRLQCGQKYSKS